MTLWDVLFDNWQYVCSVILLFALGYLYAYRNYQWKLRDLVQRTRKYRLRCQGYDNLVDMNRHLQRELSSKQHEYDVLRNKCDHLYRN